MTKTRRKKVGGPAVDLLTNARTQQPATQDPLAAFLSVCVIALLVVRWLVPAESAAEGDTLWIVPLWLAAVVVWAWSQFRSGNFCVHCDWFDAALWTVVGGHAVSAGLVFFHGGDRRAAINMAWEWVGLGATFFLVRQVVRSGLDVRRLVAIITVLGMVLAGLGIWQHFVFYPRAAREYRGMLAELESLNKNPTANAEEIRKIELKLVASGVPSDEPGRRAYENRLRFSNEPFGPFALANTFAGFLVMTLLFSGELLRTARRPLSKLSAAAWAVAFLVTLFCLVLTKSRTAWIALVVALVAWGFGSLRAARGILNRRAAVIAASVLGVVVALFVLAGLTRGFDVKVVSEAPKSIEYRLQYWRGAWGVVRDHPVFGVGPGNFRHHYLRYKVPESSEEIADPHNLILDLWTSGGLIAVIGFLACVVLGFGRLLRRGSVEVPRANEAGGELFPSWMSLAPAAAGFGLAIFAPVLAGTGDFDAVPLILLAGWLVVMAILRRDLGTAAVSGAALCAAAVGLLVHLVDLGGIEMPAIVQLLLVIAALAFVNRGDAGSAKSRSWIPWAIGSFAIVGFIGCLATATLPVLQRRALVASADQALMLGGNYQFALSDYGDAAARDPFSTEPHRKLAEMFFSRWQSAAAGESEFSKAVEALKNAMTLDPDDPSLDRRLGEYYEARFARTRDSQDAVKASEALAEAVKRYPNDAATRAKLAFVYLDAGEKVKARMEAERAMELDRINYQQQHTDRSLTPLLYYQLQQIAAQPGK